MRLKMFLKEELRNLLLCSIPFITRAIKGGTNLAWCVARIRELQPENLRGHDSLRNRGLSGSIIFR